MKACDQAEGMHNDSVCEEEVEQTFPVRYDSLVRCIRVLKAVHPQYANIEILDTALNSLLEFVNGAFDNISISDNPDVISTRKCSGADGSCARLAELHAGNVILGTFTISDGI